MRSAHRRWATDLIVKYMANSPAKNISSLDSHTMVPTAVMLGRVTGPARRNPLVAGGSGRCRGHPIIMALPPTVSTADPAWGRVTAFGEDSLPPGPRGMPVGVPRDDAAGAFEVVNAGASRRFARSG